MNRLKEKLKQILNNKMAIYMVLAIICLIIIITMVIYTLIQNKENIVVNARQINEAEQTTNLETIGDLTSVKDVNSVEELQKINKKEVEKNQKEKEKKKVVVTPQYYIKVNYGAQAVTVYEKDSKGNYTKPVRAMICSTGTYTPESGVYQIPNKFRWLDMLGDVYAQYCTQVVGDILFHSVPYLEKYNHASLEYWAYDQLGDRVSLGCIRLTCKDAKWIYDNCELGTKVEFYSSSNPGPLGKPAARKISSAPSYVRGWDPTDPDINNPWSQYLNKLKEKQKKENAKKKTEKNNKKNTNKNKTEKNNKTNKDKNTNKEVNEIVNNITNEKNNKTKDTNNENTINSTTDDSRFDTNQIMNSNISITI